MGANIKVASDSKQFQQEMQKVTQDLKLMSSELGVVTTKAELFGTEQDKLKAKSNELANSIKSQNTILGLQKQTINALSGDIEKYRDRNIELSKSIANVESKLKDSIKSTGEDSKETKALQQELNKLQKEYEANEKAIDKSAKQIDTYKIKMNETEKTILKATKELQDLDKTVEKSPTGWEKLNKSVKDTEEKLSGVNKVTGLAVGAIGTALGGAIVSGVMNAQELTKELNNLQVKTGATNEEMAEYKQIMQDIYSSNFGEGYADIAEQMALIKQVTGLTGEALKETTENAILMRDSFGYETSESIRAVDQLMKQFGVTSNEAYNLIAQGAQQGLDFSGEMIDTIVEYSVQFKKAGMDAEDMFNILLSGSQDGAFNLDKVGDAVKEFNIRLVDGSKTTAEGLKALGMDANVVAKNMSAGGEKAQQQYYKITEALTNMKDKQQQNIVGVQLFGTQFEDLGVKAVSSLQNMNDSFNRSIDTVGELNSIKYNDLESAIQGVGRQFKTGLSDVVTTNILPKINEFANSIKTNMPQIQETTKKAIDIVVPLIDGMGKAIGFIIDNNNILIPVIAGLSASIGTLKIISTVTNAIDLWKNSTFAQTLAQDGLNVALRANPIGLVVTAIGLLVGAFVYAYKNSETFRNIVNGAFNSVKETASEVINWISNNLKLLGSVAKNIFAGLVFAFEHPFEALKIGANKALDWLESKFKKLDLRLPHILLPHFNISGGSMNPLKWIEQGIPKVNVEWYSSGAIFTQPTLLGGIGVGDANKGFGSNAEAVLPLNALWNELGKNFDKLEQRLNNKQQEQVFIIHNYTELDGATLARKTVRYTAKELRNLDKQYSFGR